MISKSIAGGMTACGAFFRNYVFHFNDKKDTVPLPDAVPQERTKRKSEKYSVKGKVGDAPGGDPACLGGLHEGKGLLRGICLRGLDGRRL